MTHPFDKDIQDFLSGRIWLRLHTPFPTELIDAHIKAGAIETIPGIKTTKGFPSKPKHFCNRCENSMQTRFTTFTCAKCVGPCTYCRHCLKMGRVSTCTELIHWTGPQPTYPTTHTIAWTGTLTPKQQKASDELAESNAEQRPHLIYAV